MSSRSDAATRSDAVVIGGGLAGLTAATYLARAGHTVSLLEARSAVGGRATTAERDGYLFNQGAHALYDGGVGVEVLGELGITPKGSGPPLAGMGWLDGALSPLPYGPASLLRSRLLTFGGMVTVARVIAGLGRVDAAERDDTTVNEWIDDVTGRPDVARLMRALVRLATYADAPDLLSAGAAIRQVQAVIASGVLYLDGGWQQLVDALAARAREAGVSIVPRVTAEAIDTGDRLTVRHTGGAVTAGAVVLAAGGPDVAARLLGLDPGWFPAGPPIEASVLDVFSRAMPAHRFVLGIDSPVYFSVHGPPARLAPDGAAAAVAMRYLAPGEVVDADQLRRELDAVVAEARVTDVVDQRFLYRMTVTHGIPLASRGGLAGRPRVAVPERPGVYLAGDWVGDTGLLGECALASGRAAARWASTQLVRRPRVAA